jgi:hypothetical protein
MTELNIEWLADKRNIKDLKPWNKNPRKISKDQLNKLKQRIIARGFHDSLKIDENNVVLSGNQRLKVLKELNVKEVNVLIPNKILTEEEKEVVGLESNRNDGENDNNLLQGFDTSVLNESGFSQSEINNIFNVTIDNDNFNDKEQEVYHEKFSVIVEVKNEQEQEQLYNELKDKGYENIRIISL